MTNEGLQLLTDSSGSLGCGAFFQNKWIVLQWPTEWNRNILQDITFLELVHIVLAVTTWCKQLANKKVIFHVENLAVVEILNYKSSKSSRVMSILRPLFLITMNDNIQLKCCHIQGSRNDIGDSISRFQ